MNADILTQRLQQMDQMDQIEMEIERRCLVHRIP